MCAKRNRLASAGRSPRGGVEIPIRPGKRSHGHGAALRRAPAGPTPGLKASALRPPITSRSRSTPAPAGADPRPVRAFRPPRAEGEHRTPTRSGRGGQSRPGDLAIERRAPGADTPPPAPIFLHRTPTQPQDSDPDPYRLHYDPDPTCTVHGPLMYGALFAKCRITGQILADPTCTAQPVDNRRFPPGLPTGIFGSCASGPGCVWEVLVRL